MKKPLMALFACILLAICGHESRTLAFIFELFYIIYFIKSSPKQKSSPK